MSSVPIQNTYRFCPRCAAANPTLGDVPFKCGECGFASFFGPVAAVGGLVLNRAGALLLVRRARNPGKGKWGLPGGFVDRAETVEQALVREVVEETGLVVTATEYLMSHPNQYDYHGVIAPVIDLFYVCQVDSADQVSVAQDELDQFEWTVPAEAHLHQMAFESNRIAVEYWSSGVGG